MFWPEFWGALFGALFATLASLLVVLSTKAFSKPRFAVFALPRHEKGESPAFFFVNVGSGSAFAVTGGFAKSFAEASADMCIPITELYDGSARYVEPGGVVDFQPVGRRDYDPFVLRYIDSKGRWYEQILTYKDLSTPKRLKLWSNR